MLCSSKLQLEATLVSSMEVLAAHAAGLRVEDVVRAPAVVADFRKVIRQDPRIIQKLHRRVFVDKLTRDQVRMASAAWLLPAPAHIC